VNHGTSTDKKPLENPKQHLLEQDSSCSTRGTAGKRTRMIAAAIKPRLNPGLTSGARAGRAVKERAVL